MSDLQRAKYLVRFESLSDGQLDSLRQDHVLIEFISSTRVDGFGKIVYFYISESMDYAWIKEFAILHNISDEDYGIIISLVTKSETSVLHLPPYVTELIRTAGGYIDFSYTFI